MLLKYGRVTGVVSEIYRHNTRERIWIEESVRLVRDKKTGEPLYYDGTLREVTETMRRLELQDRYNKIASIVSACLYQHRMTPGRHGQHALRQHRPLSHLRRASGGGRGGRVDPAPSAFIRTISSASQTSLQHSSETLTVWQCEYRVCLPDGTTKWVFAHAVPEREADGSTLWHGYITDISERKRSEAKIYELAYFDPLTKLPEPHHAARAAAAGARAAKRQRPPRRAALRRPRPLQDAERHEGPSCRRPAALRGRRAHPLLRRARTISSRGSAATSSSCCSTDLSSDPEPARPRACRPSASSILVGDRPALPARRRPVPDDGEHRRRAVPGRRPATSTTS